MPNQQWRSTLPALRAFVTANYDQPNPHNQAAMASPPTITITDAVQPSGLTTEYRYSIGTDGAIRYFGGANAIFGGYARRFPVATVGASGGNVTTTQSALSWRATFVANAQKVSFAVIDGALVQRFIVNGQYVSTAGTALANSGGACYIQLDFGTKAARTVAIEGVLNQGFEKAGIAPADAPITAITSEVKRMIVLGDSFGEGTGATYNADGLSVVAGDMLGILDTWQSGVGGTGYLQPSTKVRLSQRLNDANTTGPWDIIVVAMGLNDIGLSTSLIASEAALCFKSLRSRNPAAQIFVVGPWDVNAPAAPVANYAATKAAIQSAIPAGQGFTFLDPEGVTYTKADATHPNTAGHDTLGKWLALQIKTALGA